MVLTSTIYNSFKDAVVWGYMIQIFILVIALLVGNVIRRKIPFIKRSLMPTSLLGGLIILIFKFIPEVNDFIDEGFMEIITYHTLGIGFIALAFKTAKESQKTSTKTVVETGLVTGAVYLLQAFIGLAVTITMVLLSFDQVIPGGGVLLALGFGQGTGQALNYGKLYETNHGFVGGTTFGLTIATMGFIVSSIVGVIYMNILKHKGKLRIADENERKEEVLSDYVEENEIPNTESVDKFTINISLILVVYAIVFAVMKLINLDLIWGFNFLLGTIIATGFRQIFKLLKKHNIMHRDLTNNYLLDRISGFMFDIMIIAGVAAIDLTQLSNLVVPLLIICILGAIGTFIYVRYASNHLYKGYENQMFFAMFGMLTGTASNGMILLREVDPKFETPAATTLVLQGLPAIAFGGALLLLLAYCPLGLTEAIITLVIVFVALTIYTIIIFRRKIFKKKQKN